MTADVTAACMRLLQQARRGDEYAHRKLVDTVVEHYLMMVKRFYTVDPILGWEDIKQEFFWGIWRAVPIVDHRGDPIFHLAQRGEWAVRSIVTAANKKRHGTSAPEGGVSVVYLDDPNENEPWREPADESPESDPHHIVEIHEDREEAFNRVLRIIVHAELRPQEHDVLHRLLSGELDISEKGAGCQLAADLGVSGQRVSQILKRMRAEFERTDAIAVA